MLTAEIVKNIIIIRTNKGVLVYIARIIALTGRLFSVLVTGVGLTMIVSRQFLKQI